MSALMALPFQPLPARPLSRPFRLENRAVPVHFVDYPRLLLFRHSGFAEIRGKSRAAAALEHEDSKRQV